MTGGAKVRPRLSGVFRRDERMGIYLQVYNFTPGSIEYEVAPNGSDEQVLASTEDAATLPTASTQQMSIEKLLPLANLQPGQYTLKVKITDQAGNQTLAPTATFTII